MRQYIRDLLVRRDLLVYLVFSGLKAQHRNSFLGFFWWLLDPLLGVFIYYFLVAVLLGRGGENYGSYLVVGLVAWRWILSSVNTSAKSIANQSGIITKVYLPKAIFPLSMSISQLINFAFGLVIVVAFLLITNNIPDTQVLWLPVIMATQLLFLGALGLLVAYICVFIKDIDNFISHFMRIWFYSSPVIWETGMLPTDKYPWLSLLAEINPVTTFLTSYRNIFIDNSPPLFLNLLVLAVLSVALIVLMNFYYSRNEHKIIKAL